MQFLKKNKWLVTIVGAALIMLVIYFWKDGQMKKAVTENEAQANTLITQTNSDMLRLVCKPLVWSIRSEMLRGNMEQVDLFTSDLVKEKNFQVIHVINPNGEIQISTNKKIEGTKVDASFDQSLLSSDSIITKMVNDSVMTVAAPVMGFDSKLATIVFNYKVPRFIKKEN